MALPEKLYTLSQAARRVPPYADGKHVSPSTVWRWIVHGITIGDATVKLESHPIGRRLFIDAGALEKFSRDLRKARETATVSKAKSVGTRTDAQRACDVERAERELEKAGL